jgi:hypothetical protein
MPCHWPIYEPEEEVEELRFSPWRYPLPLSISRIMTTKRSATISSHEEPIYRLQGKTGACAFLVFLQDQRSQRVNFV